MTVLTWIIVLPLFLALIAQVAFCVIGLSGLGTTVYARIKENTNAKLAVTNFTNRSK